MTTIVDGTTGITTPTYNGNVTAEYLVPVTAFKNRIINGAMVIDQRNAGASVTPTSGGVYTLDRWNLYGTQASKASVQQNAGSVTPPIGFKNYLGITSASAYSIVTGDIFVLWQRIEGFNVADLSWGTANAKTITLSFQVYSSLTGTFGGSLTNADATRSYPFTYTISSANTWTTISVTIAGDITGTWNTTNGLGIGVYFSLGTGSTYTTTGNAWTTGQYYSATGATSVVGTNGATFYITGVQLEKGSTATSFDYRPYGTELQLCQRYFFAVKASENSDVYCRFVQGDIEAPTSFTSAYTLPVRMRVTPTLTTTGTASNYGIYSAGSVTACSAVPNIASGNPQTVCVVGTVASGLTAGRGATLLAASNNTAYLYYGAEL